MAISYNIEVRIFRRSDLYNRVSQPMGYVKFLMNKSSRKLFSISRIFEIIYSDSSIPGSYKLCLYTLQINVLNFTAERLRNYSIISCNLERIMEREYVVSFVLILRRYILANVSRMCSLISDCLAYTSEFRNFTLTSCSFVNSCESFKTKKRVVAIRLNRKNTVDVTILNNIQRLRIRVPLRIP
ncbi:hypothetical protein V1477_002679 [Vespula maculifrons]|uniref:Uncharacterized protein n=1 Tax=Vespula maculifrons TaxID=7453 RepID=A0ABD2CWQ6_VESMC